ncbi:hypothetical protein DYB28_000318 [Aphanomyces astaci]|uniref:Chloride channel protein n=1 Tax=Aphanomyces astaci TaxID=112090 RepID=A0A9X8EC20_APHAT|nr:hypothetical protein DYB28_000318 [Aphanomyces astaci]
MSAFHFSAVNEIVSPVLRDDHDEMMWERQALTPSFEFNNVAGRLMCRESGDLDASKDITLFDGEYHSIYVSPAPKGVDMREYLSPTCLVVKMAGLVTAYAAGLSIGKEGPFIMMSCCFADILMQMGYFRRVYEDSSKRLEMLSCACAAGVAATFGTPFGGVLFSVEVTSSFYMVRNLPRSFFAALAGAVTIAFLVTDGQYGLFDRSAGLGITDTNFTKVFTYVDAAIFVFIGVVSGVLGAVFISIISVLVRLTPELVCVVVPLPAGIFTPTFVIGGIFGRLVGEAIVVTQFVPTKFEPYEFAIIGAAAFSAGVTRAISTAVIIMEISHNGYDVLISTARLPRLLKLPKAAYDIPTWEVMKVLMNPSPFQVVEMTTMQRVDAVFRMLKLNNAYVTQAGRLVGVVSRARLMRFLGTATKYRIPGVLRHLSHIFCNVYPDEKHDDANLKNEPNADDYVPIP